MMKNILVENMLRFGTKNVSESDVKSHLTEVTLKEIDPQMENASKFLQSEWSKDANAPQYGSPKLMYIVTPFAAAETKARFKYSVALHRATPAYGKFATFLMPQTVGSIDWWPIGGGRTAPGFADQPDGGSLDFQSTSDMLDYSTSLKEAVDTINSEWNSILPNVAINHINGQKSKLATTIANIKSSKTFASLAPYLTGTAKTVYDIIAA